MKKCVFCSKSPPEVKMSREHVLRAKLAKVVLGAPKQTDWGQKFIDPTTGELVGRQRRLPQGPFDSVVNDICKTCNEGWLNNCVEIPAEKYIEPLVIGAPLLIDGTAKSSISLWASKTAAVRGLMDPHPRGISQEHYEWIMRELSPPPFTYVWMGRCLYNPNTQVRHSRFQVTNMQTGRASPAHASTFSIGCLALFVVGCGSSAGESYLAGNISLLDSMQLMRLWPAGHTGYTEYLPYLSAQDVYNISSIFVPKHLEARMPTDQN
jgi:hypothetical protein